jgi:hypothetical protein
MPTRCLLVLTLLISAMPAARVHAQGGDFLTDEEEDKVRETQDPSERIELYLSLAQARLDRADDYRLRPPDPKYDTGAYLDKLVGQYVSLTDELKNWIQDQYERRNDMRRGLRKLLESGPKQLEMMRRMEQTPDPYAADYRKSLHDAIDNLSDTMDGATKALGEQEKQFGEMKREEKAEAKAAKARTKEEQKRAKEEKKLRKKLQKHGAPAQDDQD